MAQPLGRGLNAEILDDFRNKQAMIEAACRCLSDERSYRFFAHLASLSETDDSKRKRILTHLEGTGDYAPHEVAAIRRLVETDAASAFKGLVDMIRDIRIEQEIEALVS